VPFHYRSYSDKVFTYRINSVEDDTMTMSTSVITIPDTPDINLNASLVGSCKHEKLCIIVLQCIILLKTNSNSVIILDDLNSYT